jgi:hypothetical protein
VTCKIGKAARISSFAGRTCLAQETCLPGERPGGQQPSPNALADANPPSRPVVAKNCATVSSMICWADFTRVNQARRLSRDDFRRPRWQPTA